MMELFYNPYLWLVSAVIFNFGHMLFHVAFFYGYNGKRVIIYDAIMGYLGALSIIILVYMDRDTVQLLGGFALPFGVTLFVMGLIVHVKGQLDFNKYTKDRNDISDKNFGLIDRGIYGYLKHPMYTGGSISYLGISIAASSYLGLATVWIWILLISICGYIEEVKLRKDLPKGQYEAYSKRTWF